MSVLERLGTRPSLVLWVLLILTAAGPVGDALADRSTAVTVVAVVGLWIGWAIGLVALLVPRSSALTVVRIVVPAGVAAILVALVSGDTVGPQGVLATAFAAAAAVSVLTPWVGEAFVDGSSYGNEHRLPLRPPAIFGYLIAPLTWLVVILGVSVGPLMLAAGSWIWGAILTVVGLAVVRLGVRSLHQLTRRWVVLVPTGMVLHDHLTMPEPQLFPRASVRRLGPAPIDAEAVDLTAGAPGIALRLETTEPIELLLRRGVRSTETVETSAILFSPSRPGRLLDSAGSRRIRIG